MHGKIKKKNTISQIYEFILYSLSLSLSLSLSYFYFILIYVRYTHEFTLSFFSLLSFQEFIYIRPFIFCTLLTHLERILKKLK